MPAPEALSFRGSVIIYQPIVYAPGTIPPAPRPGFPAGRRPVEPAPSLRPRLMNVRGCPALCQPRHNSNCRHLPGSPFTTLAPALHESSVLPAPEALSFRGSVIIYQPIVYAPRNNTASPPSGFPCRPAPGRTRPEFEAAADERPWLSGALSAPPQQQLPAHTRLPIHRPCASPSRRLGLASLPKPCRFVAA